MRAMKDSGVEWMGEIPEEWEVVKCKHLATVQAGFPFDSAKFSNSEGTPLIRIRDITSGFTQTYYSGEYDSAYIVSKGDLLIGMDGDFNIRMWQSENALLNQRCCRILSNSDIELSFLYYCLPFHLEITNNLAYATTVKHLSNSDVLHAPIPYPSKSIRGRIISFLNNKCAEIDKVVEQTRATIEEYKKLKQAIITEAVTKGVRGARPMKPSGVEWIGDIPEEWNVCSIKLGVSKVGSGKTPSGGAEVYLNEGVLFLRSQNIYDTGLQLDNATYISESTDEEMSSTRVYAGDVLLNITGGSIGRCCVYPADLPPANVNQHVCIIRTVNSIFTADYMHYFWISFAGKTSIQLYQTGGNREGMSADAIKNTLIPRMDISEQQEITIYLDTKCAEIDRIIEKKEQLIEELGSYKKSLIYEYVTGKKAVQA